MSEPDTSTKEGGDEYRRALKTVLGKQLKELIQQLEDSGIDIAVMTADIEANSYSHFGTSRGEMFIAEQKDLMENFLEFCCSKSNPEEKPFENFAGNGENVEGETYPPPDVKVEPRPKKEVKKIEKKNAKKRPVPVTPAPADYDTACDVLKFEIPQKYVGGITENEVAGLVGRIVATQLVTSKQKAAGDAAGSTSKFRNLLDAANKALKKEKKTTLPEISPTKSLSTPGSTRSGRKVSSKFLQSINSLKKQSKVKDEASEDDAIEEENVAEKDVLEVISSVESAILKRVHVKDSDGKLVDATLSVLTHSQELETLAILVIHEIDLLPKKHEIFSHKYIKVMILTSEDKENDSVKAEIVRQDWSTQKKSDSKPADSQQVDNELKGDEVNLEEMNETEASDLQEDLGEFYKDLSSAKDADYTPSTKSKKEIRKFALKIEKIATLSKTKSTSKGLVRRPKMRHYTETMPVECQHCGITLTGRSNLKSHIKRVHMHIRNHTCTICSKGFWSSNALESHMLSVHTRQCEACQEYVVESVPWVEGVDMRTRRDVICTCGAIVSICSMFGRKRLYLRDDEPDEDGNFYHKRPKNNSGTKYACGTCGKLFMKKSNCERHSRRHTDVKNCVCDICGTAYTYESSLKKHMASEHGVVRHVCDICGGNYASATALKVHIVKAHRNVTIGEDVAIVVKQKVKEEAGQQEEMETSPETGEEIENEDVGEADEPEIIVNGSSGEVIVQHKGREMINKIQTSSSAPRESQAMVVSDTAIMEAGQEEQIVLTQGDTITSVEEHIILNQGSHIVVTSDGTDQTAQLVSQVLDGQVVGQDGKMSIIIKKVPVENEIF